MGLSKCTLFSKCKWNIVVKSTFNMWDIPLSNIQNCFKIDKYFFLNLNKNEYLLKTDSIMISLILK